MSAPRQPGSPDGAPVLVLAPRGRDGEVIRQMLAAGHIACQPVDGSAFVAELRKGDAPAAILVDEALGGLDRAELARAVAEQPPWSDFPFILLTRRGGGSQYGSRLVESLGAVTILERPLHPAILLSAARAALRARSRQREAQAYLLEREGAEERLRELAATLEQKVAERTQALASANDRLTAEIAERERAEARLLQAQKMEAIGQLTGGIAHDFNNLLTAVVGSLDLLTRRTEDERLLRLARNAMHAAERGAKLTGQLLAFSRRQLLTPAPVDVNRLVSGMGDLLARSIGPTVRIETVLERGAPPALADATQLEVMVLNLAINARDAMPNGGKLTISTRVAQVASGEVEDLGPGQYVVLCVRDDGVGMPPHVIKRAFEPFFTTKDVGKGTGLGLSQVYGIARQSGGTARIESEEGRGTQVEIYLPRAQAAAAGAGAEASAQADVQGARILVVDDDSDVLEVVAAMIEDLGHAPRAFGSGAEAMAALHAGERFDLVLTDVAMPGMNGIEFARQAQQARPELRILFASGYADLEQFGAKLEDERLVKKPYRMADLSARLAQALSAAHPAPNVVQLRPGRGH